jgi:hypothetical protein
MYELKNWSVIVVNPFQPPEIQRHCLNGNVYGHPRFKDGETVTTSPIQGIIDYGTHKVVSTVNSKYKVNKDDINPEYEAKFSGAYDRLTMKK